MVAPNGYDERFAALLTERGLTEKDVAAALGVSYQAVKKIVDGKSKMMAADNNARAAALLNVDSDWLATGDGHRERGRSPFSPAAQKVAQQFDQLTPEQQRTILALLGVYAPIIGVEQAAAQAAEREPKPPPPASIPPPAETPRGGPSAKRAR